MTASDANIHLPIDPPSDAEARPRFKSIRAVGRFAVPISGCELTDPITPKPPRTHVRRGEALVERWHSDSPAPLAPADGRIAAIGCAKLTARLTVPAVLFEPDSDALMPAIAPPAGLEAIPEMLRQLAHLDLAAGIQQLKQLGVWADRWSTPDLLAQLRAAIGKPIDTLLCSVLDESPDLLLHQELAMQFPVELVAGVLALARLTNAKESLIVLAAFGDVAAWEALRRASADTAIRLEPLRDHYPQAHPTLLIHEITGRHSRPVKLPVEAGVLVLDAAAAIAVGRCFINRTPMLSVPVGFRQRLADQTHWLDVPIGMPWSHVLAQLSINEDAVDLRAGNPLRELRLTSDSVASGAEHCIMASPHERFLNANACIRCAWCVEGCPVRIQPAGLLEAAQQNDPYLGDTYGLDACIECGICSYVCPSNLPILAGIRTLRSLNARNPVTRK